MAQRTAYIDGTAFTYEGITSTTFTDVTLESGFSANSGDAVYQTIADDDSVYDTEGLLPNLGDRVFKDIRISDQFLYNQEQLDRVAKAFLEEFVKNHTKVQVNVVYSPYLRVGQTVKLTDTYNNIDQNYFIDAIQETNGYYSLVLARYP